MAKKRFTCVQGVVQDDAQTADSAQSIVEQPCPTRVDVVSEERPQPSHSQEKHSGSRHPWMRHRRRTRDQYQH